MPQIAQSSESPILFDGFTNLFSQLVSISMSLCLFLLFARFCFCYFINTFTIHVDWHTHKFKSDESDLRWLYVCNCRTFNFNVYCHTLFITFAIFSGVNATTEKPSHFIFDKLPVKKFDGFLYNCSHLQNRVNISTINVDLSVGVRLYTSTIAQR